eukprot:Gb_38175 [translate_table: standard]
MDLDDFRTLFESSGVDIWTVIDMAITVASIDFCKEFKSKRDQIAARLYATTTSRCRNCDSDVARLSASSIKPKHKSRLMLEESHEREGSHDGELQNIPHTPFSENDEDEDLTHGGLEENQEDNQEENQAENHAVNEVLRLKELLEDSDQDAYEFFMDIVLLYKEGPLDFNAEAGSQEALVESLESLLNMHISVEALKETDIGRQVNGLRKHSSNEVRKLVKQLIRKWKDLVDEWVNTAGEVAAAAIVDIDCNGDKMYVETNSKVKVVKPGSAIHDNSAKAGVRASRESVQANGVDSERRKSEMKQKVCISKSGSTQKPTQNISASERLASAKKRLQEKYQEAENGYGLNLFCTFVNDCPLVKMCIEIMAAKRQRTVQVMDLQDIPKARNTYIPHNKGGNQNKHRFGGK